MQETRQGSVTLVLGGARSGKSRYAQHLAEQAGRVVFVATATRSDEEMSAKIDRHRADRPKEWLTVEEPLELGKALTEHERDCDVIVVDCLTLFAANLLEAEGRRSRGAGGCFVRGFAGCRVQRCAGVERSGEWRGSSVCGGGAIPESAGRDESKDRQNCR